MSVKSTHVQNEDLYIMWFSQWHIKWQQHLYTTVAPAAMSGLVTMQVRYAWGVSPSGRSSVGRGGHRAAGVLKEPTLLSLFYCSIRGRLSGQWCHSPSSQQLWFLHDRCEEALGIIELPHKLVPVNNSMRASSSTCCSWSISQFVRACVRSCVCFR